MPLKSIKAISHIRSINITNRIKCWQRRQKKFTSLSKRTFARYILSTMTDDLKSFFKVHEQQRVSTRGGRERGRKGERKGERERERVRSRAGPGVLCVNDNFISFTCKHFHRLAKALPELLLLLLR